MTFPRLYLTNSEISAVRTCERRWSFAYEDRLRPVRTPRPLTVGRAVHAGIAAVYERLAELTPIEPVDGDELLAFARDAMVRDLDLDIESTSRAFAMFEGESTRDQLIDESAEAMAEATAALGLFVDRFAFEDHRRFDVLGVEVPFEVPLRVDGTDRSRVTLRGRFDVVLRERATGRVFWGEHKSTADAAHEHDFRLDVDPQIRLYSYAARELYGGGVTLIPCLLNVVRKSAPREPKINLDGTVSTAAIDTTRQAYEAAVQRAGAPQYVRDARTALAVFGFAVPGDEPDPKRAKAEAAVTKAVERWSKVQAAQRARAEQLPSTIDRWAFRAEYTPSAAMLDAFVVDAWQTALHVRDLRARRRLPVANGASCNSWGRSCPYRVPCVDPSMMDPDEYEVREHPHAEALDDPEGAPW